MKKAFLWVVGLGIVGFLVLFLLLQLIPYGRNHANPPVLQEPAWNSPETRALAVRACYDCHSNETKWPWYSNIAPVSWLLQRDVEGGRERLNFSEWSLPREGRRQADSEDLVEVIREGKMPLRNYLLMHPEARLSEAEKEQLISGLSALER